MIDTKARKKAAEVARRFVAGQITNLEFENSYPASKDPAIRAIEDTLWCFYDDFEEHCLKGEWKIPDQTKALMLRWVAFLYSNQEYEWPKTSYPGVRPIEYGLFGRVFDRHKKQHNFLAAGEIEFWPFINRESFNSAMQKPVLLANS